MVLGIADQFSSRFDLQTNLTVAPSTVALSLSCLTFVSGLARRAARYPLRRSKNVKPRYDQADRLLSKGITPQELLTAIASLLSKAWYRLG